MGSVYMSGSWGFNLIIENTQILNFVNSASVCITELWLGNSPSQKEGG